MLVKYVSAGMTGCSSLQKCVSHISAVGKYVALSKVVKTVVWPRNVLNKLGVEQISPRIFQDHMGSIERAAGGAVKHFNKRSHIDIYHNYILSILEENVAKLAFPPPLEKMKADSLTKRFTPRELWTALDTMNSFGS